MELKQQIHEFYQQLVNDKIQIFRDMMTELTEDSKNDAKSSAGDKHETAISMMQIEQEKINRKLTEILEQKAILDKINNRISSPIIGLGSLVFVNDLILYIATALPKITIDNQTIFALSPQSPLASCMIGQKEGYTFEREKKIYTIKKIF